jgi:hypothetical protein
MELDLLDVSTSIHHLHSWHSGDVDCIDGACVVQGHDALESHHGAHRLLV